MWIKCDLKSSNNKRRHLDMLPSDYVSSDEKRLSGHARVPVIIIETVGIETQLVNHNGRLLQ
jgi:hypothetical protein